jgi:hypothetical protein
MVNLTTISAAQASLAEAAGTVSSQLSDTVGGFIKAGQDQAAHHLEQVLGQSRERLDQTTQLAIKGFDDLAGVGRQNLDAVLAGNQAAISGLVAFWRELATFNQAALNRGLDAGIRLLETRNPRDAIAIQAEYVKANIDDFVKLSDVAAKTVEQVKEPLNQKVLLWPQKTRAA